MQADKRFDLLALSSIPLIMTLGNSMLIPVLPEIRRQLKVSSFQTSLLITVYSVMAIFLIPIAGYLSDRIGRKAVIIPSLIITGIGGGVCGAAAVWMDHSYSVILLGRVLQGIGAAGAMPIVLPLVGDMFKSDKDVSSGLGIIETANTCGKVLSPILGTALVAIVWHLPFWAIPVMCLISILLVLFFVKQPKESDSDSEPIPVRNFLKQVIQLIRENSRWLIAIFVIGGLGMFMLFSSLFYLSESLEDKHGYKGIVKGLLLAIPLAVLSTSSFIAGKCIGSNKIAMKWIIVCGLALTAVGLGMCILTKSVVPLFIWLSAAFLGIGASLPCLDSFITASIEKKHRGTISSLYSSMRFVGVAAGPMIAALVMNHTQTNLFLILCACGVAAALSGLFAIRASSGSQQSQG
ncbi:bacillibactin exporter [Paenibacillus alvei]|uniref:Bacillibactin exporter n=1 Tax=Paenibacillus alvei TaxID=44250 RepID=A0A383RAJ6_PAEAL|nr:bacillibactin exporter [Paenibacillus alvei]